MNLFSTADELSVFASPFGHEAGMGSARVAELLELLPVESFMPPASTGTPALHRRQAAHRRRAQMLSDPASAWRFVEKYAERDEPLPWSVTEDALRHSYDYLATGHASPEFTAMLALAGHPTLAPALRALLVARDADIGQAAEWLGAPQVAVQWFAVLLWNVYYRRDERGFVQAIVFPHSRLTDLDADQPRGWEAALLQLAWLGGTAAVKEALGGHDGDQSALALADLEAQLLQEVAAQVRLGGLRRRTTPALREALLLVRAQKIHDLRQPPPPVFGLGGLEDISRRHYVSEEIMAHAKRANTPAPEDPREEEIRAKLRSVRRTPAGENTNQTLG